MGMHDTFHTTEPVLCPLDGFAIPEWKDDQGGVMLTWQQGRAAPLEADDSEPDGWHGDVSGDRLPPFFGLRGWHADHDLSALGETNAEDIWTSIKLAEVRASVLVPGEFWPPIREGGEPTPRFEGLRLWRAGVGLYPEALARLEAERERKRAELPIYGGAALCRLCWEEPRDPPVAVILGYPGFVCARHLAEHTAREDEIILR
jgi:hypothetical protein